MDNQQHKLVVIDFNHEDVRVKCQMTAIEGYLQDGYELLDVSSPHNSTGSSYGNRGQLVYTLKKTSLM